MEQLDLLTAIAYEEGRPLLDVLAEATADELPPADHAGRRSQLTELPGETFEDMFTGGHTDE